MSLKALIDAAEYVDKGDKPSEDSSFTSESSACAVNQRKLSGDSTITHWRKRAVAQSVLELNNKTSVLSNDMERKVLFGVYTSIGTSFQDLNYAQNDGMEYGKDSPYHEMPTPTSHLPSYGEVSDRHESMNSQTINSEDAVTLSANSHPSSSPLSATTRKSFASSPRGTAITTVGLPESSKLPDGFSMNTVDHKEKYNGDMGWHESSEENIFETTKKRHGSVTREAHNQLEKSRRKHLKQCYEGLRCAMPNLGPKTSHLIILREALKYIQILEERRKKLQECRFSLTEENALKQKRLKELKSRVSKYMDPKDLEVLLMKQHSERNENDEADDSSSKDAESRPKNQPSKNSWTQNKQTYRPINGFVPASSVFPPLSSALNLANEARRLCTMLPSMRMLPSAEVHKNAKMSDPRQLGNFYQAVNYPSSIRVGAQFQPVPTPASFSNVRAYTSLGVSGGNRFMQANPLKIVVKQVDSAKQQARVARPLPISQIAANATSDASKNLDTQDSSVPSSNMETIMPFYGRGAASPPLLCAAITDHSKPSVNNNKTVSISSSRRMSVEDPVVYRRPRSKSDIEDISDDSEIYIPIKKGKSGSSFETYSSRTWKMLLRKKSRRRSLRHRSNFIGSNVQKVSEEVKPSLANLHDSGQGSLSLPMTQVNTAATSLSAVSALVNPSKSITQVSFTTLNNTKPAIPLIKNFEKSHNVNESSKNNSFPCNQYGSIPTGFPDAKIPNPHNMFAASMAQNMVPVMMPVMASPSMGFMMPAKSVEIYSSPSIKPPITVTTQTTATSYLSSSKVEQTDSGSQTFAVKPQVPQFQCMMPVAFPGMMAGSNCPTMMMRTPMNGFFPAMMPQGQGWGFMMPQGMMMMANNQKDMVIQKSTNSNVPATKEEIKPIFTLPSEKDVAVATAVVSTGHQSSLLSSASSAKNPSDMLTTTVNTDHVQQQQFPMMMSPGFQNTNHYMMPMAAPQGGFYFGGTPTMMPTPGQSMGYPVPMNVMGFPMQFAGSNPFQFAIPGSNFNMSGQQSLSQSPSDNVKENASDSSALATDK